MLSKTLIILKYFQKLLEAREDEQRKPAPYKRLCIIGQTGTLQLRLSAGSRCYYIEVLKVIIFDNKG